jgi:F-type H+-transporting ATPase subunit b
MLSLQLSTAAFQIVNFLILLGGLTYFLYRPLLRVMDEREARIAKRIAEAEERARQAAAERDQLAAEIKQSQTEADRVLAAARDEAVQTANNIIETARRDAAAQLQKAREDAAEDERAAVARVQEKASDTAIAVAVQLIQSVAGQSVHRALLERLLDEKFGGLASQFGADSRACVHKSGPVVVQSAYPLSADEVTRLTSVLATELGADPTTIPVQILVVPALIAGLRVTVGTTAIDLSLQRLLVELKEKAKAASTSAEYARV